MRVAGVQVPPGLPSFMRINEQPAFISRKQKKRAKAAFHPPSTGECTCFDGSDVNACEFRWYCCDCKREMMHRYGDLYARCSGCWADIETNLP